MAETSKTGFDRIDLVRSVASDNDFTEDAISDGLDNKPAPAEDSSGYVTLDVANLSLLAASSATDASAGEIDLVASSRVPTLSRKGLQRGRERKVGDSAGGGDGGEKSALLVHVAGEGEEGTVRVATTPRGAGAGGGSRRGRRLAFRSPSAWLDPRRVLVFFATLSSMGTLILLYFTFIMGNIPAGDDNAR